MALESLGRTRKIILDGLRGNEAGNRTRTAQDAVGTLTPNQLDELSRFIEKGGWSDQLKEDTLKVLEGIIAARKKVLGVFNTGEAAAPVTKLAPEPRTLAATAVVAPAPTRAPVAPPTPTAARTPRAPEMPPKVAVSRSAIRPPEGR